MTRFRFFLLVFIVIAQQGLCQNKELIQVEKKLSLIENLFQNGSYVEVIEEAEKLMKSLSAKSDLPRQYFIKTKIYNLKANYSILEFEKNTRLILEIRKEIEALASVHEKSLSYLYLTQYYNEIGSGKEASEIHSRASSLEESSDKWIQFEYEIERVKYLIEQKYLVRAKQALHKAESIMDDTIAGKLSLDSPSVALTGEKESYLIKSRKALLGNLMLLYLIKNGNYAEAEKQFPIHENLILKTLGSHDPAYSKCIELKADLCWERQQYKKAYKLYQDSYTHLFTSDYQQHKIYLLSRIATLSAFLGDITAYDQCMRRLQLHADRNIHKYNYYQLAHGYADAYYYFVKSDYLTSLNKLKKINNQYSSLPINHFFRHLLYSLEANIYVEDAQLLSYQNLLDTLAGISKRFMGETSPAFLESFLNFSSAKMKSGKFLQNIENKLKSTYKDLVPQEIDSTSLLSLNYLNVLAGWYFQTDQFMLAKVTSDKSKQIAYRLYGPKSWEYILIFLKNVEYNAWAGNYNEAITDYSELENLDKYMKGIDNSYQYIRFHHSSGTGKLLGDFNLAKVYSLRALKLLELEHKNQRLVFSDIREQAASTFIDIANLYEAEKLLTQSLSLKKQKLGTSDPSLLIVYKELTRLYIINGNFTQSDKMLSEYLKLSKQLYGENSISYSEGNFLRGQYFLAIGDNTKAKESFESCLKTQLTLLGEKNLLVAITYLELSQVTVKMDPDKLISNELNFKKAGSIIEATIGKENQLYVQYQQLLAEFYISFAKYNQATEMLIEANRYWEAKLGSKNIHTADIAMLMGKISYLKSLYKESETYYARGRNIYESVFSDAHPSYCAATAKLAKVYYMLDDKEKSLSMMEICIPKYLVYVEKYFPSLSFQEKSKFWFSMKDEFEFYNFLVLSTLSNSNHKLNGSVYDNIIATKALLLSSDIKLRKQIASSGDTTLIRLFGDWLTQKELLTTIISYSKEQLLEQGLDPRKIELSLETLEKEMSTRSELFRKDQRKSTPTWKDIQASLSVNEYAVEIVRYRYFDKTFKDSILYAALIVSQRTKDGPELVLFPDGRNMESRYLKYYRNAVVFNMDDEFSYDVYWKPIKSKIPNNARIYLSSDGVYNQVNVEMFMNTTINKFVIDENQLVQLTNTKDIIEESGQQKNKKVRTDQDTKDYILCGNPSFYFGNTKGQTLKALPGAENEVKGLNELLDKSGRRNRMLLNVQVTEDTLKSFKNPTALHIATHGYFKETDQDVEDDFGSNPLLNSGLMLAGAGDIIDHENNKYVNVADGILTAYEVINMQLDKTEIVILSACETGKGQLKAGEGVYGLQRSFLVAGANCVVLSLFKVNDDVTKELMLAFYANWIRSNDKRMAFREAKKLIKEKYKSPIYWGAFIMIEGKNQHVETTY